MSAPAPPRPAVSVILPVFNERDNLTSLLDEITSALGGESFEIVSVDDNSTDGSGDLLRELSQRSSNIVVVSRRERGGQSAALIAGAERARAEILITMDADGQNDPKDIPHMLEEFRRGQDRAVVGYRHTRAVGLWKRVQARIANRLRDLITGDTVRDTGCALRVMARDDFQRLPRFNGMHRFIPTLLRRMGVDVAEVPVNDRPRLRGVSKYGMWNRVLAALVDAVGVRWLRMRRIRRED